MSLDRILIVGCSGSGKTTLARALAAGSDRVHVELDALFHQPGWQEPDPAEFVAAVGAELARPAWVMDGNYTSRVGRAARERADLVVALDLPRPVVMARIVRRTVARAVTRRELWNGNREQWRNLISTDPGRNIVLWAWHTHGRNHQRALQYEREAGTPTIRLTSTRQVRRFRRYLRSRTG